MALSTNTKKACLCHSSSSSKVIYSQAVGAQSPGRHKLVSLVRVLVLEVDTSFQTVHAVVGKAR